jgi:DNA replication protein DnaC
MEALTSSPWFALLRDLKTLPETCPRHPDEHMVQLGKGEPFCRQCQREVVTGIDKQIELDYFASKQRYLTTDVLLRDSIFDDDDVAEYRFDTYSTTPGSEMEANKSKARHIAGQYLNPDFGANTVFSGVPGTGKTHLAMSMLQAVNEHINPPVSCLFVNVNELAARIKASYSYPDAGISEADATKMLGDANLLVLDDLGSEAAMRRNNAQEATEFVQRVLYGILNKRKGRTIITTNMTKRQLLDTYNQKLVSRIFRGVAAADTVIKFTEATTDKRMEMF